MKITAPIIHSPKSSTNKIGLETIDRHEDGTVVRTWESAKTESGLAKGDLVKRIVDHPDGARMIYLPGQRTTTYTDGRRSIVSK